MKSEEYHRAHLAALIQGDPATAAKYRQWFKPYDHSTAIELMRATAAVCLEPRFGPGAGLGAGPVDFDELPVFMAEIRRAGLGLEPPPDFLAVEAAVRSLYGEPHLLEPLTPQAKSAALYTIVQHQTRAHNWLKANTGTVIDRAKAVMTTWLLG
jgi:hypothetical protein